MSGAYSAPASGCYRRVRGVRVLFEQDSGLAICDYPLRAVRLPIVAAQLLAYCSEERSSEELARHIQISMKRVEALCEHLCRKGLLEAGPGQQPGTWPGVSIVIPSRNRASQLERCLRSLLALDYPADALEIVIVDDASTDETQTMLQRFVEETARHGWTIQVLHHASQQGVGTGRNTGAEAASHDLLAYIDSDCVASPGWLQELVPAFQDGRTAAVGGLLRAYERTSIVGRYEDVRSSLFMGMRAQEVQSGGAISYVPSANLLVRRQAWQQLEGFAPLNFGEDVDFCRRLLAAGYRVYYLPYGTVYHDYRTHLRDFLRTRVAYASSEAILLRLHPHERRTLILPPEQATFTALAIGRLWGILARPLRSRANVRVHPTPLYESTNTCEPVGAQFIVRTADLSAPGQHQRKPGGSKGSRKIRRGEGGAHGQGGPLWPPAVAKSSSTQIYAVRDAGDHKGPPHVHSTTLAPTDRRIRSMSISTNLSTNGATRADKSAVCAINRHLRDSIWFPSIPVILALILTLIGAYRRWRKVREQRIPVGPFAVAQATLRAHLAYTYHICRHLTRYYTLPMLLIGLLLPPLLPLALLPVAAVIGVDYVRLHPDMGLGAYAFCSLLDDCAYGLGVVLGCIKYRTWKPLVPVIRWQNRQARTRGREY